MASRRKGPPKPITLVYAIIAIAACVWLAVYLRGGCRKPELDKAQRAEATGDFAAALVQYKDLLRRYPNDRTAATRIAVIYCEQLKQPEECVAWADKLRAIYTSDPRYRALSGAGHLERGRRFMAAGDRSQAEASLLRASELVPESWDAADELGRLYEAAGDAAKAAVWKQKRDALTPPP